MTELKKCPCGKTPKTLSIMPAETYKWRYVSGDCCGEWMIEARVNYCDNDDQVMEACITCWNETVRAES